MSDSLKRSHSCGLLTKEAAGEQVVLCGWVAKRRDHGGLIFVDLRDRSGIVQIVVDPDDAGNSFTTAEAIRSEYVIKVAGKVRLRDAATVNPNLATGEIEVVAADLEVLNAAKTPPFYIQDDISYIPALCFLPMDILIRIILLSGRHRRLGVCTIGH